MEPKIYSVTDHDIQEHHVDSDALYVLKKLRQAGFVAYLVGGGVRDLLLKRTPKDFDISTSALPEEIKKIFSRRCILIGRRFLLAHVRFGHKVIEVSTFRSGENASDLIVHDNQWGTPEEDVMRRDFTINGLFYDPFTHTVIDYVGGWQDIHSHVLRTIGEAETRFKQDPVRMIRLLKFRARFGFKIDAETRQALLNCRQEILKSAPARVTEEVFRMLESGASSPFFKLLRESGLLDLIYPALAQFLKRPHGNEVLFYLACVDKIGQGSDKHFLSRPLLIACLVYPFLKHHLHTHYLQEEVTPHLGEIIIATNNALREFHSGAFPHFPRRLTAIAESILVFQYRLAPLSGKAHPSPRWFKNKDFLPALQFLKVRALIDKSLIETYTLWKTRYTQHARQGLGRRSHPPGQGNEDKI